MHTPAKIVWEQSLGINRIFLLLKCTYYKSVFIAYYTLQQGRLKPLFVGRMGLCHAFLEPVKQFHMFIILFD